MNRRNGPRPPSRTTLGRVWLNLRHRLVTSPNTRRRVASRPVFKHMCFDQTDRLSNTLLNAWSLSGPVAAGRNRKHSHMHDVHRAHERDMNPLFSLPAGPWSLLSSWAHRAMTGAISASLCGCKNTTTAGACSFRSKAFVSSVHTRCGADGGYPAKNKRLMCGT